MPEKLSLRELDILVAEKVMGYERNADTRWAAPWKVAGQNYYVIEDAIPRYSTDLLVAWRVLEKMKADGADPDIQWNRHNQFWRVRLDSTKRAAQIEADSGETYIYTGHCRASLPLAICVAALSEKGCWQPDYVDADEGSAHGIDVEVREEVGNGTL